jgi:hypothetical protein
MTRRVPLPSLTAHQPDCRLPGRLERRLGLDAARQAAAVASYARLVRRRFLGRCMAEDA